MKSTKVLLGSGPTEDARFNHPTCPDKRPHPGWGKPNRLWLFPQPLEDAAKNFERFYPADKSNIYKDYMQEGKVEPVMNPNQDPSAKSDLYRKSLKKAYTYDRRWWYPWPHQTEAGMTYDPRDKNPWNINRYYSSGQLDFRDDYLIRRPDILVAENWKPITEEESRAVKERSEILGRNRRYYWKMRFHPKYDGHFDPKTSDAQYAKWNRINSQFWYIFNVRKDRADVWRSIFIIYVFPLALSMYYDKKYVLNGDHKYGRHTAPVVNKYGAHVSEYRNPVGPKSMWTREETKDSMWGWFTGMFVNSCGDDWSAVQHDQYKRTVAYGKGKGDLEEWPKMPEDWNNKQHLYWDSAKAQKAGSGFNNPDFWSKYE